MNVTSFSDIEKEFICYDPKLFFGRVDSPGFGVLKLTPWRIELFDISNRDNPRQVWQP